MGFKLLVVEASRTVRDLIAHTVETLFPGAELHVTASGFEALKLLARQRMDLMIADVHLEDIDGVEWVNFVNRIPGYRETPLVVLAGEGQEAALERSLALGASASLRKPLSPERLESILRHHLGVH